MSEEYFVSLQSSNTDQLSPESRPNKESWTLQGYDVVFPPNTAGRYMYAYIEEGGDMYIAEIEVYGQIGYGKKL